MTKNKSSYAKLVIGGNEITCQIRHSRKAKYLRLQIRNSGDLEVILPRGFQISDAEGFLHKKSDWIRKHTRKRKSLENKFYLLGKEISIKQNYDLFLKKHKINFRDEQLVITSPANSPESIEYLFESWLKKLAKKSLVGRVKNIAGNLNFEIGRISIRGQKTRWGSCSTNGNLSFNYNLLRFRKEVIDYVIIHELCHLKEMNHSEKFWKLVKDYCPDYVRYRKELKNIPLL